MSAQLQILLVFVLSFLLSSRREETDTAAVGPCAYFTLLPSGRRQGAAGRRGMKEEPL